MSSSPTFKKRFTYFERTSKDSSNSRINIDPSNINSDSSQRKKYPLSYTGTRRCWLQGKTRSRPSHHRAAQKLDRSTQSRSQRKASRTRRSRERREHPEWTTWSTRHLNLKTQKRTHQPPRRQRRAPQRKASPGAGSNWYSER
jgi:hypothetical protein